MAAPRTLIAVFIALALAGHPVVAAILPCCCASEDKTQSAADLGFGQTLPCCHDASPITAARHATQQSCSVPDIHQVPATAAAELSACGCIHGEQAIVSDGLIKTVPSSKQLSLAAGSLPSGLLTSSEARSAPVSRPDLFVPVHPPLSVLYCIWLN